MIPNGYITKATVKSQSHVACDCKTSLARKMSAIFPAGRIHQMWLVLNWWFTRQYLNDIVALYSTEHCPIFHSVKNGRSRAVMSQASELQSAFYFFVRKRKSVVFISPDRNAMVLELYTMKTHSMKTWNISPT